MDAFFLDSDIERFPPESVRLIELRATPYPDNRRIRVALEMTPFLKRPNLELELLSESGVSCGSASLVEPMGWKLELTMHIRSSEPLSVLEHLTLTAILSYPGIGEIDRRQVAFTLTAHQE